ncbi:MAG: PEP-CTERM sorting domain-containing protein [Verrucomicrobia bacterium]|nr:PEP-CTERM sorting domain-containing protein [Verrucomicrobiota bacterium]
MQRILTVVALVVRHRRFRLLLAVLLSPAVAEPVLAQPITVPNYSFELQTAPNTSPYVNTFVDAWEKNPEPAYYDAVIGTPFGIPWAGTAGVFFDINPYLNREGAQVGYLLAFPEVALFQDYNSTPTHDFNATFEIGQAYNLTIGMFGKPTLAPGNTLELSLYYRDDANNKVTVGATTVSYSAATFSTEGPLNLIDFEVNVPHVGANDPWAGRNIGIQLLSTVALESASGGNWDFDNVRLTAVPEPAMLSLLALGAGGLVLARRRMRQRN